MPYLSREKFNKPRSTYSSKYGIFYYLLYKCSLIHVDPEVLKGGGTGEGEGGRAVERIIGGRELKLYGVQCKLSVS